MRLRAERQERTLATTLTKQTAEDLTTYLKEIGLKVQYLHSDIDAIERVEVLRSLRSGEVDCVVGINLLREGLDLPEVSLVAILDADKEGFLRSESALIQTAGRAARHIEGRVILYADTITGSMQRMMDKCDQRREKQMAYNAEHNITPRAIKKAIPESLKSADETKKEPSRSKQKSARSIKEQINLLERDMLKAAKKLDFERAAILRDEIEALETSQS